MVDARRRPTFHIPGEPLMVTASPLEQVERFDRFMELTGLDGDDLLVTPIVTTPIPVYPPLYPEPGCFGETEAGTPRRRWASIKAEAMWHPLMWLPRRVALRYMVAEPGDNLDDQENLTVETDDAWAVRVCMELGAAGLYDSDTGEWLDILSAAGIDIDNDADLARVEEWLDGEPDPILDAIDLTHILDDDENPDWAFGETSVWMESLQVMLWATHSESLLDSARRLRDGCRNGVPSTDDADGFEIGVAPAPDDSDTDPEVTVEPIDPDRARDSAAGIAFFGAMSFGSIHPDEFRWWEWLRNEMAERPDMNVEELAEGPVTLLVDHLTELVDDFVPVIEETAATVGGVTQFAGASDPGLAAVEV